MSYKYPIGYPKHAMEAPKGRAIVRVLACVLDKLVATNDRLGSNHQITKFHALRAPNISVKDYLERIFKYASCSSECFVLALIYIDRVIQRNQFVVNSLNVHRVLITAIMLAAKFFDDQYYNNGMFFLSFPSALALIRFLPALSLSLSLSLSYYYVRSCILMSFLMYRVLIFIFYFETTFHD